MHAWNWRPAGPAAVLLVLLGGGPLSAQEPVAENVAVRTPVDSTPIAESPITEADRAHWAFAPVQRPELPDVSEAAWLRSPIDAFILAELEMAGLARAPDSSRATLLRRLTFDLTGLPPTPGELAAFESDQAPDAYERVVDRLLASHSFGERWAQHWLDLARFAETDGFEHDKVRPEAWRYRDWVIAALNSDLPYDEFVRLQVAGDEEGSGFGVQGSENPKSAIATMFCLSGPDMPDINDQLERRHNLLNELTATVGATFLGLQLGCAQCHDHKYDPLSQADFYRLRAVFEPAVPPLKRDVPYNALANQKDAQPARFWLRGDHRRPGVEVQPGFPRIASQPGELGTRNSERGTNAATPSSEFRAPRSELAKWVTARDNPLTSRVIANRLWQHHFGRGICTTPSDFGVMSGPVTHPELLDWLAVELRERDWSMKRLHRMIVCSATYRQGSEFRVQGSEGNRSDLNLEPRTLNPSDDLYSRFPRRRLEGEAIRDAMLAAAGLLTSERGGPGVMPPLPPELVGTLLKDQWKTSPREADHYKRSVYVFARRNLRYPIFEAFDRPDANASCPARNRSTTAPQSLVMLNSEFSLLTARHLAGRILGESIDSARQVELLYLHAYSRRPTAKESERLQQFLRAQREQIAAESRSRDELVVPAACPENVDPHSAAALVDACVAILNSSEFLYLD